MFCYVRCPFLFYLCIFSKSAKILRFHLVLNADSIPPRLISHSTRNGLFEQRRVRSTRTREKTRHSNVARVALRCTSPLRTALAFESSSRNESDKRGQTSRAVGLPVGQ